MPLEEGWLTILDGLRQDYWRAIFAQFVVRTNGRHGSFLSYADGDS